MKIDEIMQLISSLQSKHFENTFSKKGVIIRPSNNYTGGGVMTKRGVDVNCVTLTSTNITTNIMFAQKH